MTLLPIIDKYACSAHGDCLHEAPEAFTLDDDFATVTGTAKNGDPRRGEECPAGAISVFEERVDLLAAHEHVHADEVAGAEAGEVVVEAGKPRVRDFSWS